MLNCTELQDAEVAEVAEVAAHRLRVLIGRFPLSVRPALHTAPQDIRAPTTSCVGRFRRDQRTRKG